jgi:hypothetical protein
MTPRVSPETNLVVAIAVLAVLTSGAVGVGIALDMMLTATMTARAS